MTKENTCAYCGKEIFYNEPLKKSSGKVYHHQCYLKFCDEKFENTQQATSSKQKLFDYICKLFKITEITPMLNAQVIKMTKESGLTYNGIYLSLVYFFQIKGNKPTLETGIGIVPYIYNEAKEFFLKEKEVERQAKQYFANKKEEITIQVKPKQSQIQQIKQISIDDL